jgi:hypothetical protein
MTDQPQEEITPLNEEIEEVTTEEQVVEEKKEKNITPVKPHQKFHQTSYNSKFGGANKFGNASGKRMGRAAQRGR